MSYLPYTLTLQSNLVLTGEAGDPNSAATLHFIPGSTMRGVLAARLYSDPPSSEFNELILDGGIAFLNAYPAADSMRSMPAPLSWRGEKYGKRIHDLAPYAGTEGWPGEQLKGSPAEFVIIGESSTASVLLHTSSRLHHQRDRDRGHAWKRETEKGEQGVGTMFFYESIESGQQFAGVLRLRHEAAAARIKEALPSDSTVFLGRSRRAGYGGEAKIRWGELRETEWTARPGIPDGTALRVIFTSPYIGRNHPTGQLDPTWACTEAAEALGHDIIESIDPVWAFTVVRAYNRKWRLRVTEAPALRAGSVLTIRLKRPVPRDVLTRLENEGLGERRIEGFGRVLIVGPAAPLVTLVSSSQPPYVTQSNTSSSVLDEIEKRLLLARLEREIEAVAASVAGAESLPRPSLMGRLLVPFRAGEQRGVQALRVWLAPEGPGAIRRPARDQLHRCKVSKSGASITLEDLLAEILDDMSEQRDGKKRFLSVSEILDPVIRTAHLRGEQRASECLHKQMDVIRGRLIVAILTRLAKRSAIGELGGKKGGQRATANPR